MEASSVSSPLDLEGFNGSVIGHRVVSLPRGLPVLNQLALRAGRRPEPDGRDGVPTSGTYPKRQPSARLAGCGALSPLAGVSVIGQHRTHLFGTYLPQVFLENL